MRKNRLFYQIFIPILTLASISIIIISTFFSFRSSQRMQQILDLSLRDNLQQLIYNIENDLTLLESTLTAFSTSSSYNQIVSNPLLPSNVTDYKSMLDQIQYLEALNGDNNVTYSITSLDGKWSIQNGSLRQLDDSQLAHFKAQVDAINLSTRQIKWQNENGKITFTAYLPYFSRNKNSIAQGSINERTLLQSVDSDSIDNLAILNKSGEWLLTLENFPMSSTELLKTIQETNRSFGILNIGKHNYYFSQNKSNNRYYVIQYDTLVSQIRNENNPLLLLLFSGLAILLISITSFSVAKSVATPINRLTNSIANLSIGKNITNQDDLKYLSDSFEALISEQQQFSEFYENDKAILKNQFIIKLLNNQVSSHALQNRLRLFEYETQQHMMYYVLISKLDYLRNSDNPSVDLWYFGINKLIEETIDPQFIFETTLLNNETQVTILNIDTTTFENPKTKALAIAQDIMTKVSELLKLQVSIGMSRGYNFLDQSHIAYKEAQQALQQKQNFDDSTVVTIEDVAPKGSDLLLSFYPEDVEERIKEEILVGNLDKAKDSLNHFFNRLQEYATNSVTVEIASIRLINSLFMLNQQLGLNRVKEIQAQKNSSIYQRITEFHNIKYIKLLIEKELISPIIMENQENTDTIFKTLSNEIKATIKQNYDLDITLESIADELHYNPNYLSNIFKKEVGVSFTDYLNNYRLKMAKKLLVETDMPIKDIAEKLRYTNSQNFIRFFKKNEGTTPGAYRQENK
ncbi:helix-turn-helix transcriptional regulator [Aerococcaceae bacterium zg-BR22]|uniref:helix-turn-helix domain-containing protein n=1 Tax=Aerococcaceae bacterium zg-1292 TaxID=2774330 RepID=UPI004064C76A|nr:helix-turn-helix transcriptional regulator [Aerococcaceae bacterium zg-BR22]